MFVSQVPLGSVLWMQLFNCKASSCPKPWYTFCLWKVFYVFQGEVWTQIEGSLGKVSVLMAHRKGGWGFVLGLAWSVGLYHKDTVFTLSFHRQGQPWKPLNPLFFPNSLEGPEGNLPSPQSPPLVFYRVGVWNQRSSPWCGENPSCLELPPRSQCCLTLQGPSLFLAAW